MTEVPPQLIREPRLPVGRRRIPGGRDDREVRNRAAGEATGTVTQRRAEDGEAAVAATRAAFPGWATTPATEDSDTGDAARHGRAGATGIGAVIHSAPIIPNSSALGIGLGTVGRSVRPGSGIAGASTGVTVGRNPDRSPPASAAGATHFAAADRTEKAARPLIDGRGRGLRVRPCGCAANHRGYVAGDRRGGSVTVVGTGDKDDTVRFSALELVQFARRPRGCVAGSVNADAEVSRAADWDRAGQPDLPGPGTGHGVLTDGNPAPGELTAGREIRSLLTPDGADAS